MIVALHQPNLFPWLGFFDKMASADLFILLDNVQFTKRGYQNRVKLKGAAGEQWLTLPVKTKGRYYQRTDEVQINQERDWRKEHLRTLTTLYGGTAGFARIMPQIAELYDRPHEKLVDLTVPGIFLIRDYLGIRTPLVRASQLGVEGSGSEMICSLVKAVGGSVYLSGPSGRAYLDESVFAEAGIRVEYRQFVSPVYPQRFGPFVGGLSTLDYLFHDPDLHAWNPAWQRTEGFR